MQIQEYNFHWKIKPVCLEFDPMHIIINCVSTNTNFLFARTQYHPISEKKENKDLIKTIFHRYLMQFSTLYAKFST